MKNSTILAVVVVTAFISGIAVADDPSPQTLAGTKLLTMEGDIAMQMVAEADQFLLEAIERSIEQRTRRWKRDTSSRAAYIQSVNPNRERFRRMIGLRDERVDFDELKLVATTGRAAIVGRGSGFEDCRPS